ncbi:MAG: ribosome recycling factor [Clostridiales Family XIII bacterium]|jgi:ribosome recycling factor|nr:ribosome recycling factor [Clostridiales Family XIII bacterium]
MDIQQKLDEKLEKTINVLKENLNTVRAGRANPGILDKVVVEYYGSPTPLKGVANVSVPDPRTILIAPFDASIVHDIEKAINEANIGLAPSNDGKVIRIGVPELTEDRRKELAKGVKKYGEESKVALRNERRDANDHLKKQEKAGELTEDDLATEEKIVQKKIDDAVKKVEKIIADKEKEILEV